MNLLSSEKIVEAIVKVCCSNSTERFVLAIINNRQIPNIYKIDHLNKPFAKEVSSGEFFNLKISCNSLALNGITKIS